MRIRQATLEDVPAIVAMGLRFAADEYRDYLRPDPAALEQLARNVITGATSIGFVAEDADAALVGMIGLMTYQQPMAGALVATEIVWWMEPEARGARAAIHLLNKGETWAREQGATKFQMIAPTDHVGAFYERMGFKKLETHYQRSLA